MQSRLSATTENVTPLVQLTDSLTSALVNLFNTAGGTSGSTRRDRESGSAVGDAKDWDLTCPYDQLGRARVLHLQEWW